MTVLFRTPDGRDVPAVTAAEMREVDRVAVEVVGLPLLSMMENAGRNLASVARSMLADRGDSAVSGPVVVFAGGGGGLACVRHLANHGVDVRVVLDRDPASLDGAPATQYGVLATDGVVGEPPTADETAVTALLANAMLVVDALIGYGRTSAPRGRARDLIALLGEADSHTVSLDVPSGVNATTGSRPDVSVSPDVTLTLALPKSGLAADDANLYLGDIGSPASVFRTAGIDDPSHFDDPSGADGYSIRLVRT